MYSELIVQMVTLDDKLFYIDTMKVRLPETLQFFSVMSVCAATCAGSLVSYG